MNAPNQTLFRAEVLQRRGQRLHGDVSLALPVSWQIVGYLLLFSVMVAIFFLSVASYSRVENVGGSIVLDRGIATVMPTRAGVVDALNAREGQHVQVGARLAEIRAEESLTGGGTAPIRVLEALERQDRSLAGQGTMMMTAAGAERARLAEQMTGLGGEIASLNEQISAQRRLVQVAETEFRAVEGVAQRGFISQRDLRVREEALLARRQQLSQLEQVRAAKTSQIGEARRGIAQAAASANAQAAGVASNRAELAQRLADVESARGYTLTSPITGTVTAVTTRPGQPVSTQSPVLIVVPDGATPRAELYVPTSAAGFLAIGQEVRLAIDAFPYQRYGTITATISEISSAAIPRTGPDGRTVPVYLLTAKLARPWVAAFGRRQPLLPGMALSARVITERQSLFRWLFEPLFAVNGR